MDSPRYDMSTYFLNTGVTYLGISGRTIIGKHQTQHLIIVAASSSLRPLRSSKFLAYHTAFETSRLTELHDCAVVVHGNNLILLLRVSGLDIVQWILRKILQLNQLLHQQ